MFLFIWQCLCLCEKNCSYASAFVYMAVLLYMWQCLCFCVDAFVYVTKLLFMSQYFCLYDNVFVCVAMLLFVRQCFCLSGSAFVLFCGHTLLYLTMLLFMCFCGSALVIHNFNTKMVGKTILIYYVQCTYPYICLNI